jgi:hypothetical protein
MEKIPPRLRIRPQRLGLRSTWSFGVSLHPLLALLRIPVMWAGDSGDVGRHRSEATLVVFYSIQVAHMSQEKGK